VSERAVDRYGFADHHCFACGTTNPIGMGLQIELGERRAATTWVPGVDFVGWSDRVHGGLLATVLDEVMAWAPASEDAWAVTASFSVRYHAPVSPGEKLRFEGWVESKRRRIYETRGEVRSGDRLVADATGTYLGASPSQKTELKDRYGLRPTVQEAAKTTDATDATLTASEDSLGR
jgi:acyl-coenzyme A thioesterase PaaI-like protein